MRLDLPLPPPPLEKGTNGPLLIQWITLSKPLAILLKPLYKTPLAVKKTRKPSCLAIYSYFKDSPLFIKECRILDWICLGVKVR